jgi:hypothetical protein
MTKDYTVGILIMGLILLLVLSGGKCDNTPPTTPCEARKCPAPLAPRKLATGRYTTECVCVQLPEGQP